MTANMNFGPEWMRGGLPQRSNTMDSQSTQSTLSPTLTASLSSSKDNEFGSTSQDNPYKYSKDFMLSLYRPMNVPSQFDKLPFVAVDEPIGPLAFVELTDDEKKLLSGPVHAEPTRRTAANNEKGNCGSGQRYHRVGTDFHSAENGSSRPMNRSKGRPGMDNRRETSPEFEGMKNGDSENDGNGSTSWGGGREAFGSWETRNVGGGGFASGLDKSWGNRTNDEDTAPTSWSQQGGGGGGDHGVAFKADSGDGTFGGSGGGSAFDATASGGLSSSSSSSPGKHPSQCKWFYRDPSSNVQGPFNAQEMQDWYKAGFFGPTLWIRREDQDQFEPLAALVIKVGNESIFMSPIPEKKDTGNPLGNMSSFRPMSDPFGRMGNSGPLFGAGAGAGGLSSPNLASPGGFFNNSNNNQATDILSPSIGKYSPFGNHLNQGSGSNPGTPSLPLASPFGNNDANVFGASLLGREPNSPWGDRPVTPSWMNNTQSDLFGSTFQRQQQQSQQQQQQQQQQLHYQQQQQQQQHMQSMMNPLLQQRGGMRGFGGEPIDSQQQFAHMLQQRQHAMANQSFQLQHDMSPLSDQPIQQHGLGQSQVLEQLSNHASPVVRPAALTGWGSGPGTPVATEAPSSPWGSIVSPAIPQKVSEELQSKAPGQQSPRSHLSPQLQHATLSPAGSSKASPSMDAAVKPSHDTITVTTATRTEKLDNIQETVTHQQLSTPPSVEAIKSSLNKVSLHDIQQEQEGQRKRQEEARQRQLEKENAHRLQLQKEAEEMMRSKKPVPQPTNDTASKEQPSVPATFKTKTVSLLDIQAEEEKKQQELKKQAKTNNKMAAASLLQQQQQQGGSKSGWNISGSGWANETYKGPSLREIQELEAKEAQRKKQSEQRSSSSQQLYASPPSNSTTSTMSWGVVTPSKTTSVSNTTSSSSSAPAWGSSSASKKKTFFEIQQEEEVAMQKKIMKQQQQQQQQQALATKSVYSSVASTPVDDGTWTTVQPKPKQASESTVTRSSSNSGWDVVGAPKKPVVLNQSSTVTSRPMVVSQQRKPNDPKGPSEGFKMWCKQSLRDLSPGVNADEILKMLLSFPADNSVSEIIQDIIYANSTSMDGRRFAAEFMKRRRADMSNNGIAISSTASMVPTPLSTAASSAADDSFQVVNKKGKKNKAV